jgi:hypothetical protein
MLQQLLTFFKACNGLCYKRFMIINYNYRSLIYAVLTAYLYNRIATLLEAQYMYIVQGAVLMLVNYDHSTFIVQASLG